MTKYEKIFNVFKDELEEVVTAKALEYKQLRKTSSPDAACCLNTLNAIRGIYYRLLEIKSQFKNYQGGLIGTRAIYHRWNVSKSLLYYHIDSGHIKVKSGKGHHRLFDVENIEQVAELYKWDER
jgi:hypothetical protein